MVRVNVWQIYDNGLLRRDILLYVRYLAAKRQASQVIGECTTVVRQQLPLIHSRELIPIVDVAQYISNELWQSFVIRANSVQAKSHCQHRHLILELAEHPDLGESLFIFSQLALQVFVLLL